MYSAKAVIATRVQDLEFFNYEGRLISKRTNCSGEDKCFFDRFGSSYVCCRYCSKSFRYGKDGITSLKRHELATFHQRNTKSSHGSSSTLFDICKQNQTIAERVRKVELQTALFITKFDLSISISDELITFI
ncbi:hypothetical protein PGB90_000966 [Kerria lacca]